MQEKTICVSADDDIITASPLKGERDYEAAVERLEELDEGNDAMQEDEHTAEHELLQSLVQDFEEREGIAEEDDDFELVRRLPAPETVELAIFHLSNGNEVRLLATPDNGDVSVVEISDDGVEDFVLDERWSPNAIFRKFAPPDQPVPQMLMRLDRIGAFDGRKVVDALHRPVDVELAALGVLPLKGGAGLGSCWPGGGSAAFFQAHHCGTLGGPGYGKSEGHCYPKASLHIQKTSNALRRTTYTRMAAGGAGPSRLRHFYKKVIGWQTQLSLVLPPQKVCSHWSALKGLGSLRRRRVRFEALQQGGFVRGWVKYHTQCAGGWF